MSPKPEEVIINGISIKLNSPAADQPTVGIANSNGINGTTFVNNAFYNDDGTAAVCPVVSTQKEKQAEADANAASATTIPSAPNAEPPSLDFDDLLPYIGEFGTYQKILFLLMIPFAFSVAFVYFTQIFLTLVPEEHWCLVPELMHLSLEDR